MRKICIILEFDKQWNKKKEDAQYFATPSSVFRFDKSILRYKENGCVKSEEKDTVMLSCSVMFTFLEAKMKDK